MWRGRARRAGSAGSRTWTAGELNALNGIESILDQWARNSPIAVGVHAVLLAKNRDDLHAAIERYPDVLTEQGAATFRAVALFAELLGEPRVVAAIRECEADVEAIREARA